MAVFTCQHGNAIPELVADASTRVSVVRHDLGFPTLEPQVRARWPGELATLPKSPGQIPFASRAAFGRWHKTVQARQKQDVDTDLIPAGRTLGFEHRNVAGSH
jgi:hypothetical protein